MGSERGCRSFGLGKKKVKVYPYVVRYSIKPSALVSFCSKVIVMNLPHELLSSLED